MDNDEKNKALHELVKPGECWHESQHLVETDHFPYWDSMSVAKCDKCGKVTTNTDFFNPDQPHSQVVALVKAAEKRFGVDVVDVVLERIATSRACLAQHFLMIPAPEIAEAIYQLTQDK